MDVTTTTTHYVTCQDIPRHQYKPTRTTTHSTDAPHHQAHFSFQHRYRPTSFHVARCLHRNKSINVSCMVRTCSPDKEWATVRAPWPSRQVRAVCTEREPTVGVLIVIVIERVVHTQHTPHHTTPHHTTPHTQYSRYTWTTYFCTKRAIRQPMKGQSPSIPALRVSVFCTGS